MGKFVKITNVKSGIQVIPDLRLINTTNYRSPAANRLQIKPAWTRFRITLKMGTHWYPSVIKNWESVKSLEAQDYITIGAEADDVDDENAKKMYDALVRAEEKYKNDVVTNKKIAKADKQLAKEITNDMFTEN